jgi:Flp pilus assembly pilin Flp
MKRLGIQRFIKDQRGANMVEYIILVGIVAILAIAAFRYFNTSVREKVNQQADTVEGIDGEE